MVRFPDERTGPRALLCICLAVVSAPAPSTGEPPAPPTPTVWVNPDNEGGGTAPWEGSGVSCENGWVVCR